MYEVSNTDVNFYAVERAGYFNVGELISSAVNDMLQLGAFTLSNLTITDSNGLTANTVSWPPAERLITIQSPGVGYKTGDVVEIPFSSIESNAKITIGSVNPYTGAVISAKITNPGDLYTKTPAADQATKWPKRIGTSALTTTYTFICRGDVTNGVGLRPDGGEGLSAEPYTDQAAFSDLYSITGQYGKWPTSGIWTNEPYETARTKYFVGQEVILSNPGTTSSAQSNIPAGTTITGVFSIPVVSGVHQRPGLKIHPDDDIPFTESVTDFTWFTVSQPVTVAMDDVIGVRGRGLIVSDTTIVTPAGFKVIVEAGGGVDPLNDPVGVYGTVATTTSSSTTVLINNLTTQNAYNPVIYAGQSVTSTQEVGTVSGVVTVVSVVQTSPTTATVTLSSEQSLAADEMLHFVFDEPQPWRIAFDVRPNATNPAAGPQTVLAYAATANQLDNLGNISKIWKTDGSAAIDRAGAMGAFPTGADGEVDPTKPVEGFLNRELRVVTNPEVYPLNYALTLTNRGMFFGIWEGSWSIMQKSKAKSTSDKDNYFNWFLIQRPVNRYTGKVLTTGRCPVFCINSVGYKYWKFVVREDDILHPTLGDPENKRDFVDSITGVSTTETCYYRVPADAHTQDSFAVLNTTNQIALTEDSKYLVSFLHNLTTPRFRYSEELDMIGQTSADVCMAGNDVSITAYSESGPRVYRAMPSNNPYNTGLRICVLKNIPV